MKAIAIKDFKMGTRYLKGQDVSSLPEERIMRLVGEGLVSIVDQPIVEESQHKIETKSVKSEASGPDTLAPVADLRKKNQKKKR